MLDLSKIKPGQRCRVKIGETRIDDCRIERINANCFILYQDIFSGSLDGKYGYKYGWYFTQLEYGNFSDNVSDLQLFPLTLDDLRCGDMVENEKGYLRRVLARIDEMVFLSEMNNLEHYCLHLSIRELKDYGYKVVQPTFDEPEPEQMIEIDGEKYTKNDIKEALRVSKHLSTVANWKA